VRISIDDFGTGYSSLSYLHRLPLNTLKVDRTFVSQMHDLTENLEIVRAVVTLAHSLNLDVVAEGVESPAQLSRLRELGCEFAQGFCFSRPVDSDTARGIIEGGPQELFANLPPGA
jgi:EAL domain-containing protein (putative c-di-GMP-specific phosphodiesterase class I)